MGHGISTAYGLTSTDKRNLFLCRTYILSYIRNKRMSKRIHSTGIASRMRTIRTEKGLTVNELSSQL